MGPPQPPGFSWIIFLSLLAVLAASGVTFWLLMRRMTSHRQWVSVAEWAREHRFHFSRPETGEPPAPMTAVRGVRPKVRLQLTGGPSTLVQLEAEGTTTAGAAAPPAQGIAPSSSSPAVAPPRRGQVTWNLLIRATGGAWPPTGLRPANAAASVLDLFSLSSFPTLAGAERFIAYGTD